MGERLAAGQAGRARGVPLALAYAFDAGAVITPFYDSLLVKITASGQTFEMALDRMDRALREFRIRGVKTNIPFLENVIHFPIFRGGQATTTMIDTSPQLFEFKARRDRATKLLQFLGNVIVNGNPHAKGYKPAAPLDSAPLPAWDRKAQPPKGTRQLLLEKWMRDAKINDIFEGTQQINQMIVARRILGYSSRELS